MKSLGDITWEMYKVKKQIKEEKAVIKNLNKILTKLEKKFWEY